MGEKYHTPSALRSLANPLAAEGGVSIADYDGYTEYLVREYDFFTQALESPEYTFYFRENEKRFIDVARSVMTVGYVEDFVVEGRAVELLGGGILERKRGFHRAVSESEIEAIRREGRMEREERERMKREERQRMERERVARGLFEGEDTDSAEVDSREVYSVELDSSETTRTYQEGDEDRIGEEKVSNKKLEGLQGGDGKDDRAQVVEDLFIRPIRTRAILPFEEDGGVPIDRIRDSNYEMNNTAVVSLGGYVSSSEESADGSCCGWTIATPLDRKLRKGGGNDGGGSGKEVPDVVGG